MLYTFLKTLVQIALKVFYKKIHIKNKHLIPSDGPLIIVANHPNTLMDPLVIAAIVKLKIHFLAKGTLFNSPFKEKMLSKLNMVPVYRQQDFEGENREEANKKVFEKCFSFLAKKGTLLIFPEGTSIHERRLREIKTGTARIALGAEEANDFGLGVKILTIGLNYSNPKRFRSELLVSIDEPISIIDYKAKYSQDQKEGVKALSDEIKDKLENHIVVTRNEEEDRLTHDIEMVFKKHMSNLDLPEKEEEFELTKRVVDAIQYFEESDPDRSLRVKSEIKVYLERLEDLKLKDSLLESGMKPKGLFWEHTKRLFLFFLGLPLFLYGLINNYLPYIIPSKVATKVTNEVEYLAPIMMVVGMFTFPIFYLAQIVLVYYYSGVVLISLLYFISLPLSGYFALYFSNYIDNVRSYFRVTSLFSSRKNLLELVLNQRKKIISELKDAREEYLKERGLL